VPRPVVWPLFSGGRLEPHASATPGSLSNDDTYAVAAYILSLNGIVPADGKLDRESLPKIKMPNRGGFVPDPEFDPARLCYYSDQLEIGLRVKK
jgi:hypothetical protein